MVSGEKTDWNDTSLQYGASYWDKKNILIRIHPDELAKLKAFFLKYCKKTHSCNEVKSQIDNLEKIINLK